MMEKLGISKPQLISELKTRYVELKEHEANLIKSGSIAQNTSAELKSIQKQIESAEICRNLQFSIYS